MVALREPWRRGLSERALGAAQLDHSPGTYFQYLLVGCIKFHNFLDTHTKLSLFAERRCLCLNIQSDFWGWDISVWPLSTLTGN